MDLKRLVTQFAYRIEAKPEGGFIARASDPSAPTLEAPTRQELQNKIREKIFAAVSAEFPGLKLPSDGTQRQFAFHIEHTPGGGFSIHSADPSAEVIHATNENELQNHFVEKFVAFAGKHIAPELAQALFAQGAGVKVVVNGKTAINFKPGSEEHLDAPNPVAPALSTQSTATEFATLDGARFSGRDLSNDLGTIDNSPITPEPSNLSKFFRFVPVLLLICLPDLLLPAPVENALSKQKRAAGFPGGPVPTEFKV